MQISEGTVVSIDYALRDDEGTLIDQSNPGQPMAYLHGHGNIIPGLEAALLGKVAGDFIEVRVEPSEAYGDPDPALEQIVPMDQFQGIENVEVGMQFQASTEQGPVTVRVVSVDEDVATVDGNHPLAGKYLNFSVTVNEVRPGTEEEIAHGHVHQAGECCGGGECGSEGSCEADEGKQGGGSCDSETGCGCS